MNQINFKDMDTTVINDAKRIISQMNTGNECDYMEAGYLYYGMGLYGYSNDVIKSGCEYTRGKMICFPIWCLQLKTYRNSLLTYIRS